MIANTIIFFSGYIRNWKKLCEVLKISLGLNKEVRETQILLKGYQKWGTKLATHLSGMFSFAICDNSEDSVYFARDQFGGRTLYYHLSSNGSFLISDKLKDILSNDCFEKTFNISSLQNYLSFTYVAGKSTFYKNIYKLLPGQFGVLKNSVILIKDYWQKNMSVDEEISLNEWSEKLHDVFMEVITEDVESVDIKNSGLFLSGGVDSSYLLALTSIPNTYTVGFFEEKYDEIQFAESFSKQLHRCNKSYRLSCKDYLSIVRDGLIALELPIGTPATIAYYAACSYMSRWNKFSFSGEGIDELFCGYDIYRDAPQFESGYLGKANIIDESFKKKIFLPYDENIAPIDIINEFPDVQKQYDTTTKMSLIDVSVWLEGNSLLNVFKMSSAFGMEAHTPFLDTRIFDIASRIPSRYKATPEISKLIFRNAAKRILPYEIAFREKSGFVIPMRYWLKEEQFIYEIKEKFNCNIARDFFDINELNNLFFDYLKGNLDLWKPIWNIYIFIVWYDIYFK